MEKQIGRSAFLWRVKGWMDGWIWRKDGLFCDFGCYAVVAVVGAGDFAVAVSEVA